MANVEKFKYWCNKILPLVYDDSLSYYEFLGKVYEKLNETIDAVNENTEAIGEFDQRINEFIAEERQARLDWEAAEALSRHGWENEQARKMAAFEAMFVSEYDADSSYTAGDICTEGGKMYAANASTTGTFDPTKWDEIVLADYLADYVYNAKAAMQAQYDGFLEDYQRTFGVVQTTGTSTTDVMSQNATSNYIKRAIQHNSLYVGNLLENSMFIDNRYLAPTTGQLLENSSYFACDYFPVSANTEYKFFGILRIAFFTENKTLIEGYSSPTNPITSPATAAYARADVLKSTNGPAEVFFGLTADYNKNVEIKNLKLPIVQTTGSSTTDIMSQNATTAYIDATKRRLTTYPNNLLDQAQVINNRYLNTVTGQLQENVNYFAFDFFPVSPNTEYQFFDAYRIAFYTANKTLIEGYNTPTSPITTPATAAYARADVLKANNGPGQVFFGLPNNYNVAFRNLKLPVVQTTGSSTSDIMSQKAVTDALEAVQTDTHYKSGSTFATAATLSTGESITINTDNVKKNCRYSFSAKITSFTSVTFGHGKTNRSSGYVTIDATNIYINTYSTSLNTVTIAHGLTIAEYISVYIDVAQDSTASVTLNSNGSSFTTDSGQLWDACSAGAVFAECTGTLTDAALTYARADTKKQLWCFGDSYFGLSSNNRWPYYLQQTERYNYLINGYPGENSSNALIALTNLLTTEKPKALLWCLGMNDGSDGEDAPASSWTSAFNSVKTICSTYNIELIMGTIPTVPSINNEQKNAAIRASGYRYVDFAKAVGASDEGVWYTGMLGSDNVHPTAKGAQALYMEAINKVPELTY